MYAPAALIPVPASQSRSTNQLGLHGAGLRAFGAAASRCDGRKNGDEAQSLIDDEHSGSAIHSRRSTRLLWRLTHASR